MKRLYKQSKKYHIIWRIFSFFTLSSKFSSVWFNYMHKYNEIDHHLPKNNP